MCDTYYDDEILTFGELDLDTTNYVLRTADSPVAVVVVRVRALSPYHAVHNKIIYLMYFHLGSISPHYSHPCPPSGVIILLFPQFITLLLRCWKVAGVV